MKNKPSVTIGIPAYNEEKNILHLVNELRRQNHEGYVLERIIVVSDASTDRTDELVRKKSNELLLIRNEKRLGQSASQNKLAELADTDILLLLNADISIRDNNFISKIINPIIKNPQVGIVGAGMTSLEGETVVEKIIKSSHDFKSKLYVKINNADTVYLCCGRARAISKKLYKKIIWPNDCPEDSYSYFFCITNGMKFVYEEKANIFFRSPANVEDFVKQGKRFEGGKAKLRKHFDEQIIAEKYSIPKATLIQELIKYIAVDFMLAIGFLFFSVYVRVLPKNGINYSTWDISASSKKIV